MKPGRSYVDIALAMAWAFTFERWGLDTQDPFHSSLRWLPLVVILLQVCEQGALKHGGRRLSPLTQPRTWLAWLPLLGLVALTLGRHRLGLISIDSYLAAGFLILLALKVGGLLLLLRPSLGLHGTRRPSVYFFIVPLVVYLAIQPWMAEHRQPDGDEPYYLLLTHSLAYDFDTDLANNYAEGHASHFVDRTLEPQPGDPRGDGGELYSRHNILLPLVLAPAYRLAGRHGAMAMMAIFTAALAWMVLRLAMAYDRRSANDHPASGSRMGSALLAYALLAFAPPLLVYSYQIWVEVPGALLLAVAIDRMLGADGRSGAFRNRRDTVIMLLALGLLPLLKLRFLLVAAPVFAIAVLRRRPDRRTMALAAAGVATAVGAVFVWNTFHFGHPLAMHRLTGMDFLAHGPAAFAHGAVGIFFDAAFGLFGAAPLWWILIPALWIGASKADSDRRVLVDGLCIMSLYLVALWPRLEWYGGWSPPFRYPLVLLPVLALLVKPALMARRRPGMHLVLSALLAATVLASILWVVHPGWTYNFADGRTLWLDHVSTRAGQDLARWFPSTVRPRLATWLWPLVSLLAIPLVLGAPKQPGIRRLVRRSTPVVLLGALSITPWMVSTLPTGVVEIEDPWVQRTRGAPYPQTWKMERVGYRGGWRINDGGRVAVPVVSGGDSVTLEFDVRMAYAETEYTLELSAGDRHLAELVIPPGPWQTFTVGPFEWPTDAPLVIASPVQGLRFEGGGIVDRVVFHWQAAQ